MVSLWASMLHEQWFHGNSDVHSKITKTNPKKIRVPRLWNTPPSTCTALINGWEMVHCLLNYFQYSNVTLLEMFVLNTDCLNFDSVLAVYNLIFEKLPSVCKYKENVDACSHSVLQLISSIFRGGMLYMRELSRPN